MAKYYCVVLLGVVAAISVVTAATDEETGKIKAAVTKMLAECGSELGIKKEDIIAAKEAKNPDAIDHCFYACFFKKVGTLNDKGEFDIAVSKELHKKFLSDPADVAKLDAVSDTCSSVNSQSVTDGAKGCERSNLLVKCLIENKESFTPIAA